MQKKLLVIFIAGLFLIAALILLNSKPAIKTNKIQVTASFYPLYFLTQQIGQDKADVINITPAGTEPHDYEPGPKDIASIENSKLLILNGGGLEPWQDDIQKNIDAQNTLIVIVGKDLTNQQFIEDSGENAIDPHIWLSPVLAQKMVDRILEGFVKIDPVNSDYYHRNADELKVKLADLDTVYKKGLSKCDKKDIITSHSAFGYLTSTYGLNQISIAGLSPDAEPSPSQLAEIAHFAKAQDIKYIFFESLVSSKLSDTIAAEVGAQTLVLDPLEGLPSQDVAQGENYFTKMEKNLTNLKIALECK